MWRASECWSEISDTQETGLDCNIMLKEILGEVGREMLD
jgi:hypothetical protein